MPLCALLLQKGWEFVACSEEFNCQLFKKVHATVIVKISKSCIFNYIHRFFMYSLIHKLISFPKITDNPSLNDYLHKLKAANTLTLTDFHVFWPPLSLATEINMLFTFEDFGVLVICPKVSDGQC